MPIYASPSSSAPQTPQHATADLSPHDRFPLARIEAGERWFIRTDTLNWLRTVISEPLQRSQVLADCFRINTLSMIMGAGSGHIGSSFSAMDLFTWLWAEQMQSPNQPGNGPYDLFFSSKGHDAPGLYAVMIGLGVLPEGMLTQLRRLNGLPGHPDRTQTPGIISNTGSLGMGISKARGMAFALKQQAKTTKSTHPNRVYVLTGDGELQEGQFWESLQPTANGQQGSDYSNLTLIIDHNKLQSDTWVHQVSPLGDLEAKLTSFGWFVRRCNGHDFNAIRDTLAECLQVTDRPQIIIADTVKGKGVSFMAHTALGIEQDIPLYQYHSGAPTPQAYQDAMIEMVERVSTTLRDSMVLKPDELLPLAPVTLPAAHPVGQGEPQKLVVAYGERLAELGKEHPNLVVLDADLMVDCGLLPFRQAYPDRFVECGIAEQDMVSMAGGMATQGVLPVVHSFACFLSTRPNEQIFNNATEKTRIIYTGSLAGLIPSGPGHSHQCVRDIATLGSTPGLTMLEPCDAEETRLALSWAVKNNPQSTYIRLTTPPMRIPYTLPKGYALAPGEGVTLWHPNERVRPKGYGVMIGYGPLLLSQGWEAALTLWAQKQIAVRLINLPWLNMVSPEWLYSQLVAQGQKAAPQFVLTLDNHMRDGGQGQRIGATLASLSSQLKTMPRWISMGLDSIPACGQPAEVLAYHGLDAAHIAQQVLKLYGMR